MKPSMKATGFDQLYLALNHAAARVKDGARKQLHAAADSILREAKLNTPVDKHNLEESLKKEVDYGYRGRLQIQIVMGGFVNGVNVDQYAAEVHENYDDENPGEGTKEKRRANPGRHVGRKFLERAMQENQDRIRRGMLSAVMREWHL